MLNDCAMTRGLNPAFRRVHTTTSTLACDIVGVCKCNRSTVHVCIGALGKFGHACGTSSHASVIGPRFGLLNHACIEYEHTSITVN